MPESITFTWHDVAGEARPSPTTRKKFVEWRQDVETKDPDRIVDHVYYLDFLSDVIGDLQKEYDSHLTPFAEDSEESRKQADLATKGD
jgi:hypothetical protein|tara:strand:+ start:124 stop:387 length:264 start_codon:yes stop_codon:yes gene_type:complete